MLHSLAAASVDAPGSTLSSSTGHCGVTAGGVVSDCDHGDSGAWDTREHRIHSLQACVTRCRSCARCHFVSFSAASRDCSWYHACDEPGQLEYGGSRFRTVQVREVSDEERERRLRRLWTDQVYSQWRAAARRGYCQRTLGPGDCAGGQQGTLDVSALKGSGDTMANMVLSCLQRCAACARCRYVSVSVRFGDCSWFSTCELQRLRTDVPGFFTADARPALDALNALTTLTRAPLALDTPNERFLEAPQVTTALLAAGAALFGSTSLPRVQPTTAKTSAEAYAAARAAASAYSARGSHGRTSQHLAGSQHLLAGSQHLASQHAPIDRRARAGLAGSAGAGSSQAVAVLMTADTRMVSRWTHDDPSFHVAATWRSATPPCAGHEPRLTQCLARTPHCITAPVHSSLSQLLTALQRVCYRPGALVPPRLRDQQEVRAHHVLRL
jgi:hypothetical protein